MHDRVHVAAVRILNRLDDAMRRIEVVVPKKDRSFEEAGLARGQMGVECKLSHLGPQ
jgi:hypothetical protein